MHVKRNRSILTLNLCCAYSTHFILVLCVLFLLFCFHSAKYSLRVCFVFFFAICSKFFFFLSLLRRCRDVVTDPVPLHTHTQIIRDNYNKHNWQMWKHSFPYCFEFTRKNLSRAPFQRKYLIQIHFLLDVWCPLHMIIVNGLCTWFTYDYYYHCNRQRYLVSSFCFKFNF